MAHIRQPHTGWLLVALLGGVFMGNVDVAIVNVAIPSIHANLHASGGVLELIVSGYTLAYAMLMITSARLGDMRGYRRVFLLGLGLFTPTSLACGLAPNALILVVARIIQGVGAALMISQVLTGIQLNFEGAARGRALGLYTVVLSGSAVIGQILGGVLISANIFGTTWCPIFLINVPIGALLLVMAGRFLPADQQKRPQQLDLGGVAALSTALLLLVVPLILGRDAGWAAWVWICLAASIPAFAVFIAVERRLTARGGYPLLNLSILARPAIAWGLGSLGTAMSAYFGILFVLALYLQQGLGRSPLYSGLALVSWVAAFGVAGPVLGRLSERSRSVAAPIGSLILAVGFAGIGISLFAATINGALLMTLLGVGGLGLGIGFSGMVTHLTGAVTDRYAPDMSGLINTISRIGGVIGVAIFGTAYLGLVPNPGRSAAIHGFAIVAIALAITALIAAITAYLAIRRQADPAQAAAHVDSAAAEAED